jgi:hypothetical protein
MSQKCLLIFPFIGNANQSNYACNSFIAERISPYMKDSINITVMFVDFQFGYDVTRDAQQVTFCDKNVSRYYVLGGDSGQEVVNTLFVYDSDIMAGKSFRDYLKSYDHIFMVGLLLPLNSYGVHFKQWLHLEKKWKRSVIEKTVRFI